MGNRSTKSNLRSAIIYLNISADPVNVCDEKFWNQIWSEDISVATEVIKAISIQEIRMLRDGSPKNFATLTYKMVERLCLATGTLCNTQSQQTGVMNATRILIRLMPCIFEDKSWSNFFYDNQIHFRNNELPTEPNLIYPKKSSDQRDYKAYLPAGVNIKSQERNMTELDHCNNTAEPNDIDNNLLSDTFSINSNIQANSDLILETENLYLSKVEIDNKSLIKSVVLSVCDLLFCPEFTVTPHTENHLSRVVDAPPEDLRSLATCDYVWEPGVGFDSNVNSTTYYDKSRSELLRLLLVCFSTTLFQTPEHSIERRNLWIEIFASSDNRHALPLFTSLINTVFIYKQSKLIPFNHLLFEDTREELVELAIQILIATLDYQFPNESTDEGEGVRKNLFIEYMSRIHRGEDFIFIIKGFTRLLNNRLDQGYLLNPTRHINFDQELLILFWKLCNLNKKFITYLLKTGDILDIVIPILYHLNENFQDPAKTALIHIGVFNLLILSGERNFGVRLNKPYIANVLLNLPAFTGSHADLLIIVVHKLILYGQNLNQLFDFLLTIIVNVSPYLKALSMLASKCLIQLFEIFSSPFVIFTEPNYHQLVVFLLEVFNNLIQYQFDGNAHLVYAIITKQEAFINLSNLPTTSYGIQKVLNKLKRKKKHMQLIEKSLIDAGETNDVRSTEGNRFHKSNSDFSQTVKATVSSNMTPSKPSPQANQQEVYLVATPDICHVTQPIHPFERDGTPTDSHCVSSMNSESPKISLDDLLNQANEGHSNSPISTNDLPPSPISEKMSEVRKSNDQPDINESNPTHSKSRKWKPTPEWSKNWKQSLPIHTTLRMIEVLAPQLERFKRNGDGQQDEIEMIKFLQNGTLVGLLPVPHPIVIRKYRTNSETTLWFRACTWGIIYVRNQIWTSTNVKLIKIV